VEGLPMKKRELALDLILSTSDDVGLLDIKHKLKEISFIVRDEIRGTESLFLEKLW
jgi:hypothetical protein